LIAELSAHEKKELLGWARASIAYGLGGEAPAAPQSPAFELSCGAFVSIHEEGGLRGCIGRIRGGPPLLETIREMAAAAAFEDPRFSPLSKEEFGRIDIEISLLSPLERVNDVAEIEVGRQGLYIVKGWHSGLLLPQVATEYGWDRATFLKQVCHKAGMQEEAWRAPDAELYVFECLVFGEKG
jgi:AmmeMemoRadiSam system protein A